MALTTLFFRIIICYWLFPATILEQIFTQYQEVFRPRNPVYAVAEIKIADSISYTLITDNHLNVYQYRNEPDGISFERIIEQAT